MSNAAFFIFPSLFSEIPISSLRSSPSLIIVSNWHFQPVVCSYLGIKRFIKKLIIMKKLNLNLIILTALMTLFFFNACKQTTAEQTNLNEGRAVLTSAPVNPVERIIDKSILENNPPKFEVEIVEDIDYKYIPAKAEKGSLVYARVDYLNLRARAGKKGKVLLKIHEGESLISMGQLSSLEEEVNLRGQSYKDKYLKVKTTEGLIGWVHRAALQDEEPALPGFIWVKKMNIRMEPNLQSPIKAQVGEGGEVIFTGKKSKERTDVMLRGKRYDDYWYEVKLTKNEAISGWVHGSGLKLLSGNIVRVNQLLSDPRVLAKKLPASYIAGYSERVAQNGRTVSLVKLNRKYIERFEDTAMHEDQFLNICVLRDGSNILHTEIFFTETQEEICFYFWHIDNNVEALVHQNDELSSLYIFDMEYGTSYETDAIQSNFNIESKGMNLDDLSFDYTEDLGQGKTHKGELHVMSYF